jgi:hypothetical protein
MLYPCIARDVEGNTRISTPLVSAIESRRSFYTIRLSSGEALR